MSKIRFIDLFAGIGGIRKGFETACERKGLESKCVFTSEIKPAAVKILQQNHPNETICGDIRAVDAKELPDFDFLLAGFPCQAFSTAGKRLGFADTRGTLFFEVARIIKEKKPKGFVLENVEGLVTHDHGKTLKVILGTLEELGYKYETRVLNAMDFGLPQDRKRIYIVGSLAKNPSLENFDVKHESLGAILEHGLTCETSPFIENLFRHYPLANLAGKAIKDKRGGGNNISSWDLEMKGKISKKQKALMGKIMRERRKKKWAKIYGIEWMDGMPLTENMIQEFFDDKDLKDMLDDLVAKNYLVKEYPKKKIDGKRVQDETLPIGYNIVAGKMSFPINKILDKNGVAPTLVAMDMERLYVIDGKGIRKISLREGLRCFGYPDDYKFETTEKEGYDLLGNTVAVPVIAAVSERLLESCGLGK